MLLFQKFLIKGIWL